MTSQLHRSLVPIQVWLLYLLQGGLLPGESTSESSYFSIIIGMLLMVMYMVVKGKLVMSHAVAWKSAASRIWQCTVSFIIILGKSLIIIIRHYFFGKSRLNFSKKKKDNSFVVTLTAFS